MSKFTLLRLSLSAVAALVLLCAAPVQAATPSGLSCKTFLLYDLDGEQVVGQLNTGRRQPIASLTKLMTAILACERLRFDGRYVLTERERAHLGVETLRATQLLELMLVPSNNHACGIVARIVSGNEDAFAHAMNDRARELGLTDTVFTNASGLPMAGQQSTAADVLTLTRAALSYPAIRQVVGEWEVRHNGRTLDSTLKPLYRRHPELRGGKTGYTRAAGRCLSLVCEAQGRHYLLVVLGSKGNNESFRDAELILKHYGLYQGEVGQWD